MIKPGWTTTEFILAKLTIVLGALLASGLLADGSTAMRIAGIAAVVLASFGYSVSRGMTKGAAPMFSASAIEPVATSITTIDVDKRAIAAMNPPAP